MKLISYALAARRSFSTRASQYFQNRFNKKNNINKKYGSTGNIRTKIAWTDQQQLVLDAVLEGKSVFITGSGGTGKTLVLRQVIKELQKIHGKSGVAVTAYTGVAACAINGMTLHSFSGIGLGEGDRNFLLSKVVSNRKAYARWKRIKALVLDEVSMVSAELFDHIRFISEQVRGETSGFYIGKSWGGLQLVVSGDFLQLPPWKTKKFAFEAPCWDSSFHLQVELRKIFRQSEAQMIKLLQGIRRGEVDIEDLKLLERCCSLAEPSPLAVQIYPLNEDVHRVNRRQLESLGKDIVVYHAIDSGGDIWKRQLNLGLAQEELHLCIGARVVLIKNLMPWKKLVNGATGTVVGFWRGDDFDASINADTETYTAVDVDDSCVPDLLPVVKFDFGREVVLGLVRFDVMEGDKTVASRKQIPLILAWAISIHKCQGMTIDCLHTDLTKAFDYGMVYTAISRAKTLDGLCLSGFDLSKVKAHPKALQFYQRFDCDQSKEDQEDVSVERTSGSGDLQGVSEKDTKKGCKDYNFPFNWKYPSKEFLHSAVEKVIRNYEKLVRWKDQG